jgi:hypothetical protein
MIKAKRGEGKQLTYAIDYLNGALLARVRELVGLVAARTLIVRVQLVGNRLVLAADLDLPLSEELVRVGHPAADGEPDVLIRERLREALRVRDLEIPPGSDLLNRRRPQALLRHDSRGDRVGQVANGELHLQLVLPLECRLLGLWPSDQLLDRPIDVEVYSLRFRHFSAKAGKGKGRKLQESKH